MQLLIDSSFIDEWHPKYDSIEHDEPEYSSIKKAVCHTLTSSDYLPKDLFVRIMNWKAARVKGIIKWQEYDSYSKQIMACVNIEEPSRLPFICTLYGIGAPVGSTILHFMFPDTMPIMDVRTVETLYWAGLLRRKSRTIRSYVPFTIAIRNIHDASPKWSLRQIDRALFAFHKLRAPRANASLECELAHERGAI